MALHRIDLLMGMVSAGWSETYWVTASDLTAAQTAAEAIARGRVPLCNINATVVGWRIKRYLDDGTVDVSNRGLVEDAAPFGLTGAQPAPRDLSVAAVLMRYFDTSGYFRKNLWLRGLPDASIAFFNNGLPNFAAPLIQAINNYTGVLQANGVVIRQFQRDPNANAPKAISEVAFSDDGVMSITTAAALSGADIGKRVKITGYRGKFSSKVNGMAKIISKVSDTTLVLDKTTCNFADQTDVGNGAMVFLEKYATAALAKSRAVRFTKHNAGRAFFVAPGRHSDRNKCLITRAVNPSIG